MLVLVLTVSVAVAGLATPAGALAGTHGPASDRSVGQSPVLAQAAAPTTAERVTGPGRVATAAAVARSTFPDGAETATVASGADFPDALAASALAGHLEGPLLLTAPDALPDVTRSALTDLGVGSVVLSGGTDAVGPAVEAALGELADVERVSGADRYGTATAVARRLAAAGALGPDGGARSAFLATGEDFPDALAAGARAGAAPVLPILLTPADALADVTHTAITELGIRDVTVLGGAAAVHDGVLDALRAEGVAVSRVEGGDRVATAAAVAEAFESTTARAAGAVIVRGDAFPDALAAAPLAARRGAPVLLASGPSQLGSATAAALQRRAGEGYEGPVTAVGGTAAVAEGVLRLAAQATDGGASPARACAVVTAAGMSRTARTGQTILVGVPSDRPSEAALATLRPLHAAGAFLTGRSTAGRDATRVLTDRIRGQADAGVGMLVAADQEGGAVQVLSGPGFSDIPSALRQAALGPDALRAAAGTWGGELTTAGVDLDLAPVAGVVPPGDPGGNQPIGRFEREYGHTPEAVTSAIEAFAGGLGDGGAAVTLKHFPGLGRASGNTDVSAGVVDDVTTRDDPYLAPFRAGIAQGARFVMVASATYTRIDPTARAVFSPIVVDEVLRGDLGFTGVVMSDELASAAEVAAVPVAERATRFVGAGGDLILAGRAADATTMISALVRAGTDPAFGARIDGAALRVLEAKAELGLVACPAG